MMIKKKIRFFLVKVIALVARSYSKFFSYKEENTTYIKKLRESKKPIVFVCLHSNIIPILLRYSFERISKDKITFLTSSSSIAGIAREIIKNTIDIDLIARNGGDYSRVKSVNQLIKKIREENCSVGLTIDEVYKDNSGIRHYGERAIKKGAVYIAKQTKATIIPVTVSTPFFHAANTWDNIKVPFPFPMPNKYGAILFLFPAIVIYSISSLLHLPLSKFYFYYHRPFKLNLQLSIEELTNELDKQLGYYDNLSRLESTRKEKKFWKGVLKYILYILFMITLAYAALLPVSICYVISIILLVILYSIIIILLDKSSMRSVAIIDYCDYYQDQTKKVLLNLLERSIQRNTISSNGELLVVCGNFIDVMSKHKSPLLAALKSVLDNHVTVKVIITDRHFNLSESNTDAEILKTIRSYPTLSIYHHSTNFKRKASHFIVVNEQHVRIEHFHHTNISSDRYAETYYFSNSLGNKYKKYFEKLLTKSQGVKIND